MTTRQIARNVQEAAASNAEVSHLMIGIQRGTVETTTVANQLTDAAGLLSAQSCALRKAADNFLTEVRAA